MHRNKGTIDFEILETELQNAIQEDFKYWCENSAKLRAINQKVSSYNEFRDIVRAAHLKPLEKSDKLGADGVKQKGCIWNSLVQKEKNCCLQSYKEPKKSDDIVPDLQKVTKFDNSVNTLQLLNSFLLLSMEEKVELLKRLGRGELGIADIEIPVGVLGNIIETLKDVTETLSDGIDDANVIEVLMTSKRFSLCLDFLTAAEKKNFVELVEKLQLKSILSHQQHNEMRKVKQMILNSMVQK